MLQNRHSKNTRILPKKRLVRCVKRVFNFYFECFFWFLNFMTRCVISAELQHSNTVRFPSNSPPRGHHKKHPIFRSIDRSFGKPANQTWRCVELKEVKVAGEQRRRRRRRRPSFSAARSVIKTAALLFPILKMSAAADAVLIATGCCAGAAAARRDTNYHQGKWPSHPQACCSRVPAHCTPSQCSQPAASREARQRIPQPRLEPKTERRLSCL